MTNAKELIEIELKKSEFFDSYEIDEIVAKAVEFVENNKYTIEQAIIEAIIEEILEDYAVLITNKNSKFVDLEKKDIYKLSVQEQIMIRVLNDMDFSVVTHPDCLGAYFLFDRQLNKIYDNFLSDEFSKLPEYIKDIYSFHAFFGYKIADLIYDLSESYFIDHDIDLTEYGIDYELIMSERTLKALND